MQQEDYLKEGQSTTLLVEDVSMEETRAMLSMARKSLMDYAIVMQKDYRPNWHHELMAKKLEDVAMGRTKRLMLFMPPRHGKTEIATVKFPAWYLGRNTDKEIICCSYSADLAEEFGRKARACVADELHGAIFPDCSLQTGSKSATNWKVSSRGGFTATGVGGAITGKGANIFIIDDPIKNREEAESETYRKRVWDWYTSTAFTRLEKDGAIVLVQTRWHDDDLAGRLLALEGEKGQIYNKSQGKWIKGRSNNPNARFGKWDVVRFPAVAVEDEIYRKQGEALWPDKYDTEALEDIKKAVGMRDWGALYQQDPVTEEGADFKTEWFKYWKELPKGVRYITTVDLAISQKESADDSVVMTVAFDAHDNLYVVDYKNWKANPSEVIDEIYNHYNKYHGYIGVESVGYQQSLFHYLRLAGQKRGQYLPVEEIRTRADKESKIRGLIPFYANGKVFHDKNNCQDLEDQLKRFPSGKHDDVIDALAMTLGLLRRPPIYADMKTDVTSSIGIKYTKDGRPYIT